MLSGYGMFDRCADVDGDYNWRAADLQCRLISGLIQAGRIPVRRRPRAVGSREPGAIQRF